MEFENPAHAKIHGTSHRIRHEGAIDDPRLRVATTDDGMVLKGYGVVSQRNGPFTLAFRAHGIDGIIYLDTSKWSVIWGEEGEDG